MRRLTLFVRVPPYEISVFLTNFIFFCCSELVSWGKKHTALSFVLHEHRGQGELGQMGCRDPRLKLSLTIFELKELTNVVVQGFVKEKAAEEKLVA